MRVVLASSPAEWAAVRELFEEYVSSLGFPLTFQDVAREFASLPAEYGPPAGAALLALPCPARRAVRRAAPSGSGGSPRRWRS